MIAAIRSEIRKLFSVRSTYIITAFAYALLLFLSLYVIGYRTGKSVATDLGGNLYLASSLVRNANVLSIFVGIISLLLFAHEYRYSTIMYTLTNQKSRTKVLASKISVVALFTFIYTLIGMGIALGGMVLGLHLSGGTMPHQTFDVLNYTLKLLAFTEGYALAALLIITLVRNQVAAITVLLILPGTFEGFLGLLLKHNSVYMPFTALSQVTNPPDVIAAATQGQTPMNGYLSPVNGVLVFAAYLVGGWLIAWFLFRRRDAN